MNQLERDRKNELIDVLFDQIEKLPKDKKEIAAIAVFEWAAAKKAAFLGLGPMEARGGYKRAYESLKELGLEVGGMMEPYVSP
jgi:hypothetical protein